MTSPGGREEPAARFIPLRPRGVAGRFEPGRGDVLAAVALRAGGSPPNSSVSLVAAQDLAMRRLGYELSGRCAIRGSATSDAVGGARGGQGEGVWRSTDGGA